MSVGKRNYLDFDEFRCRLIFKGILKLVSPLHIGSGESAVFGPDSPVVKMYFLDKDKSIPYIPGSTLKGVFRSYIEKLARLDPEERDKVCTPPKTCEGPDYCIVCGMFGAQTLASHLKFRDAYPIDDALTITKIGIRINRLTGTVGEGALFQIQAVAPGTKFDFEFVAENIPTNDKRAQYIAKLIDALQSGEIQLGGKTSTGLGKVMLEKLEIIKITPDDIRNKIKPRALTYDAFKKEVMGE